MTINGYTQPLANPNTKTVGDDAVVKIELSAGPNVFGSGLEIASSSNSVVKGLAIRGFGIGIFVHGDSVGKPVGLTRNSR